MIVCNHEIQSGRPTIKGTGIRVDTIQSHYRAGDSIEMIMRVFGISEEDVRDCINYNDNYNHTMDIT